MNEIDAIADVLAKSMSPELTADVLIALMIAAEPESSLSDEEAAIAGKLWSLLIGLSPEGAEIFRNSED